MKKACIFAGYLFLAITLTTLSGSAVQAGCTQGDCANGPGIYTWPDGGKYTGGFLNGKFHGQGTYLWADGKAYIGAFKNDKRNGLGTYTWPNGASYTGEWENGKKSGYGIYAFPDGRQSIGLWENGKLVQKMEASEIEIFLAPPQKQSASVNTVTVDTTPAATPPETIATTAAADAASADADLEKQLAALGGDLTEETSGPATGEESLKVTEASGTTAGGPFLLSVQNLLLLDGRKFKTWENVPLLAVGPINPVGTCSVKIVAAESDKSAGKLTVNLEIENNSACALDFKGFIQAGEYYTQVVAWSGDQSLPPQSQKKISQTVMLDKDAPRSKIHFKLQGEGCRM